MKRWMLWLGLTLSVMTTLAHADPGRALQSLPIQDGGRLKPFDTFARETLQLVWGKRSFNDRSAVDVVMTWMLIPDHWDKQEFVQVQHAGLREALQIDSKRTHFSPRELLTNDRLALVFQELRTLREKREKLNPYFQAVQTLENQLSLFNAVRGGLALRVWPNAENPEAAWKAVAELQGGESEAFQKIARAYVDTISAGDGPEAKAKAAEVEAAVTQFVALARMHSPIHYASEHKIQTEVHYNRFHPFMWAWVAYLLAVLLLLASQVNDKSRYYTLSRYALGVGFILHTYGIILRVYLAGRPPVTNMYETVVWVAWGALVFAEIIHRLQPNRRLLLGAAGISVLCLILTDLAPTVLASDISPLEPVLRSTFWLSTHVIMITISYAAFFLAFALGDMSIFFFLKDEKRFAKEIAENTNSIYRSIQIGVVLLAAGIILGGVWADYSWGRFWGWDPKETWALIALLGYLAVLHGRLSGWLRSFGLAVGSVVSFSLVIMSWYGVNFVLGAGLHSYGFGAGGVEYVSGFVAFHLLLVTYAVGSRWSRNRVSGT